MRAAHVYANLCDQQHRHLVDALHGSGGSLPARCIYGTLVRTPQLRISGRTRGPFDKILLDKAREHGVEVREQHRVRNFSIDDNGRSTVN